MASFCPRCSLHIPDGMTKCRMCGSSVLAAPPPVDATRPIYSPKPATTTTPELSRWLIVVAIGLLVLPVLRIWSIATIDIPLLFTGVGRDLLNQHDGLIKLVYFEMIVSALLVLLAVGLNLLFYSRNRRFPHFMIAYSVITFLYHLVDTAMTRSILPHAHTAHNFYPLVRSLLWTGTLIVYLLTAPEVKARFVK